MFHLWRFIGFGRVSEPLLRMNDKWPVGRPSTILFHNLHSRSSSILPDSLHWTVRDVTCCQDFRRPGCLESDLHVESCRLMCYTLRKSM